jgi:hypothetical protein
MHRQGIRVAQPQKVYQLGASQDTIEGITIAAQIQGIPLGQECGQGLITNNNGGMME